jgi:hypothetical protein
MCDLCGEAPCDWETFWGTLWEEYNVLREEGVENKVVRHHAYKLQIHVRHGVFCHFDHKPLPVCVCHEIKDVAEE